MYAPAPQRNEPQQQATNVPQTPGMQIPPTGDWRGLAGITPRNVTATVAPGANGTYALTLGNQNYTLVNHPQNGRVIMDAANKQVGVWTAQYTTGGDRLAIGLNRQGGPVVMGFERRP